MKYLSALNTTPVLHWCYTGTTSVWFPKKSFDAQVNLIFLNFIMVKSSPTVLISCYEGVTRKIELIFSLFMLCSGSPSSQIQKYHSHKLIELGSNEKSKFREGTKCQKLNVTEYLNLFMFFSSSKHNKLWTPYKQTCNLVTPLL